MATKQQPQEIPRNLRDWLLNKLNPTIAVLGIISIFDTVASDGLSAGVVILWIAYGCYRLQKDEIFDIRECFSGDDEEEPPTE